LVDLTKERVELFSEPAAEGGFGRRRGCVRGETLVLTVSPGAHLRVDDLFG
jgi:hypothetical protein